MSLEKIASRQSLQREDIVAAAREYAELEKQAADADAAGRELAHKYVAELVKQAEAEGKTEEEKKKEEEKTASDKELASALETLRKLLK